MSEDILEPGTDLQEGECAEEETPTSEDWTARILQRIEQLIHLVDEIKADAEALREEIVARGGRRRLPRGVLNRRRVAEEARAGWPALKLAPGIAVDWEHAEVRGPERTVRPTWTEWLLLKRLAAEPGKLVPDVLLYREIWTEELPPAQRGAHHRLRVHLSRLKTKLVAAGCDPTIIDRRNGVGYRLLPAEREASMTDEAATRR